MMHSPGIYIHSYTHIQVQGQGGREVRPRTTELALKIHLRMHTCAPQGDFVTNSVRHVHIANSMSHLHSTNSLKNLNSTNSTTLRPVTNSMSHGPPDFTNAISRERSRSPTGRPHTHTHTHTRTHTTFDVLSAQTIGKGTHPHFSPAVPVQMVTGKQSKTASTKATSRSTNSTPTCTSPRMPCVKPLFVRVQVRRPNVNTTA